MVQMKVGKLPPHLLHRLLEKTPIKDARVLLGPAIGEDAAVVDMGDDNVLIAKTDPITFATDDIGWYSVHINANDIAVTGGTPRWYLATLLVPEHFTSNDVDKIFNQIVSACSVIDVSLIGGHTEITYGLDRPVVVGFMLGEALKADVTPTSGARPGDCIVLTKGISIEGTAVLAREVPEILIERGVSQATLEHAKDYLYSPGISVLKEANKARSVATVNCMHDPTEGGLATGLQEIAKAANVGMRIEKDKIPILPECQELCDALEINPLGLLASGALVLTTPAIQASGVVAALESSGVGAYNIGEITSASKGIKMVTPYGEEELPSFPRDELARFFSSHVDAKAPAEGE